MIGKAKVAIEMYQARSVSYERRAVFQRVIICVGARFEKTLIAPVSLWGAEMRCSENAAGSTFTSALSAFRAQGAGLVSGGAS